MNEQAPQAHQGPQLTNQTIPAPAPALSHFGNPNLYQQVAAMQGQQAMQAQPPSQEPNAGMAHPHTVVQVPVPQPPPIQSNAGFKPTPEQIMAQSMQQQQAAPTPYQSPQVHYIPSDGRTPAANLQYVPCLLYTSPSPRD